MAIAELQQANTVIDRAASLLLIVPVRTSVDALASMIALYLALQTQTSESPSSTHHALDAVSPSHIPPTLQFLPGSSQVTVAPRQQTDVVMDIAGPLHTEHIRTEQLTGGIRLHILFPPNTKLSKQQIETTVRTLPYDAAIVIGAADLEELGAVFATNADFFYNTPIINIDHRAENEHFGTVNLVDITAGSCAEITYEFITSHSKVAITPEIATALYAGIIAGTESFQKPSTTPRSFQTAAQLMEHRANREAVIQHLVKTKPFKLIKLLGRIYARLRHDEHLKLYWSTTRSLDLQESQATPEDISSAMEELVNNIAGFNAAFLLYESSSTTPGQYRVYVLLGKGLKQVRREIQELLGAVRENGALTFSIAGATLEAAEQHALEKIRGVLPQ